MTDPKFSIVVPTRDRAETLAFALRTCLAQAFENYEVLVSDNDGSPRAIQRALGPVATRVKPPGMTT